MKVKKDVVTSRANPLVVAVSKLSEKKERDRSGTFVCDGSKLTFEYIKNCGSPLHVLVNEKCATRYLPELAALEDDGTEIEVTLVSDTVFPKLTEQRAPDGIMCVGEKSRLAYRREKSVGDGFSREERIIMLCSLRDNGNVGTVVRTALALGYDRVILSADCADIFAPKTLRASMGAVFCIKTNIVDDTAKSVEELRRSGRRVFAAELRADSVSLDGVELNAGDVFVIGNEGHGIPLDVSMACDESVFIPISPLSESLNAASAATILMWQQRTSTK